MELHFKKLKIDKVILEQLHEKFKRLRESNDTNIQPKDRDKILKEDKALLEEISKKLGRNLKPDTKPGIKIKNLDENTKLQSTKELKELKVKFNKNFRSRENFSEEEALLGSEDGNDSEVSSDKLKDEAKKSVQRKSNLNARRREKNFKSKTKKENTKSSIDKEFKKLNKALKKGLRIKKQKNKIENIKIKKKIKKIEKMANADLEENEKEKNIFRCCGLMIPLKPNKNMPSSLGGEYTPSEIAFREVKKQNKTN